jgi:hypothetical protein
VHNGAKMSGKKGILKGKYTIGASGPNVLKTNVIKYKIKYGLMHKHMSTAFNVIIFSSLLTSAISR